MFFLAFPTFNPQLLYQPTRKNNTKARSTVKTEKMYFIFSCKQWAIFNHQASPVYIYRV